MEAPCIVVNCLITVLDSYTPTISSVLKFAWIQYMSIFVVVAFLLFTLNSFIFRHQVSCVIFDLMLIVIFIIVSML